MTEFDGCFKIEPVLDRDIIRFFEEEKLNVREIEKDEPSDILIWDYDKTESVLYWNGEQKISGYLEWLNYLNERFFKPGKYEINGKIRWRGEDFDDYGTIIYDKQRNLFQILEEELIKQLEISRLNELNKYINKLQNQITLLVDDKNSLLFQLDNLKKKQQHFTGPFRHVDTLKRLQGAFYYDIDQDCFISSNNLEKYKQQPYRISNSAYLVGKSKTMSQLFRKIQS